MRRLVAVLVALAVVSGSAAQAAPRPRVSLAEMERDVMCLVCGTTLNVSDSPQADRERAYIIQLIAQGKTKKQIEDALVAQYGPRVLATPPGNGFDLAVWIVPGLAVVLAAAAIALAVTRWRRGRRGTPALAAAGGRGQDDARLRSDLERYDL